MKQFIYENQSTIETVVGVAVYVLRQIDLKRIKSGKKPLFNFLDLIKFRY